MSIAGTAMCRAGERHCEDWRRLRGRDASYFAPDPREGIPDVGWAQSDMGELWADADADEPKYGRPSICAAVKRLEQDKRVEPAITDAVIASTPGGVGELAGLAARMKSPQSLARKIADKSASVDPFKLAEVGQTPQAMVAAETKDTIRYTVRVEDPGAVVSQARTVVSGLQSRGFKVVEAESFYSDGAPYKGLHTTIQAPDGARFELQFHSRLSLEVKEGPESEGGTGGIHKFYEFYRERNNRRTLRGREMASACYDECVRQSRSVPMPQGIEDLTSLGGTEVVKVGGVPDWYIAPEQRKEYTTDVRNDTSWR